MLTEDEKAFCRLHGNEAIQKMERYQVLTGERWPSFNHFEEDLGFDTIQDWYAALCAEVDKLEAARDIIT